MDRRTFIAALAAAAVPMPAMAATGISIPDTTVSAFLSVPGIHEGSGRGTIHVLFAPWCPYSARFYRQSRALTGRLSFRWMPFSGGLPQGSEATERLLANPHPSALQAAFTPLPATAATPSTPLADAQDESVVARIAPLLARDTGRGLVTPTLAWSVGPGRGRLATGGLSDAELSDIAALAV